MVEKASQALGRAEVQPKLPTNDMISYFNYCIEIRVSTFAPFLGMSAMPDEMEVGIHLIAGPTRVFGPIHEERSASYMCKAMRL